MLFSNGCYGGQRQDRAQELKGGYGEEVNAFAIGDKAQQVAINLPGSIGSDFTEYH